jgi:hypothetical protein
LLHISRLCDPARSLGFENSSLRRLDAETEVLDNDLHVRLRPAMQSILNQYRAMIEPQRNKRLAHSDLASLRAEFVLPAYSRYQIRSLVAEISAYLNQIQSHFFGRPTSYEHVSVQGGGDSLIHFLKMGERLHDLQRLAWTNADNLCEEVRKLKW